MIKSQKNSVKSGEIIACNRELQRVRRDDRESGKLTESQKR